MSNGLTKVIVQHGGWLGKLRSIQEEFVAYRDYDPEVPEGVSTSGKVLPFVKGLYLSAKLIYIIREITRSKYHVNWGHIVHESGIYCSPECDIIIHHPDATLRWNGGVLDFHFVNVKAVVAVISCKSLVRSIDDEYASNCVNLESNQWHPSEKHVLPPISKIFGPRPKPQATRTSGVSRWKMEIFGDTMRSSCWIS
jgi:hypothetical protein